METLLHRPLRKYAAGGANVAPFAFWPRIASQHCIDARTKSGNEFRPAPDVETVEINILDARTQTPQKRNAVVET